MKNKSMDSKLKKLNLGASLIQFTLAIGLVVWLSTKFEKRRVHRRI
jgi:hypothetical protein